MNGKPFQYCPFCSEELQEKLVEAEHKMRRICPSCGFVDYQNPTPAAGVVLVDGDSVLLVKRKYEPRVGGWTLPAGFVEVGEDVATCAAREAKEETNLDVEPVRLFGVYSAFDDPRASVVLILFVVRQTGGTLECGDDASDARFFEIDKIPENIAFRAHRNALADLRKQICDGLI